MAPDRYLYHMLFSDEQVVIAQDEEDDNYMCNRLAEEYIKWDLNMYYS